MPSNGLSTSRAKPTVEDIQALWQPGIMFGAGFHFQKLGIYLSFKEQPWIYLVLLRPLTIRYMRVDRPYV